MSVLFLARRPFKDRAGVAMKGGVDLAAQGVGTVANPALQQAVERRAEPMGAILAIGMSGAGGFDDVGIA